MKKKDKMDEASMPMKMPMDKKDVSAKMEVLQHLKHMMGSAMGSSLKNGLKDMPTEGLKKVTVASNSPEGLKEGLSKAEGMLPGDESEDGMGDEEGDTMMASDDSPEEEMHESDIDKQIEMLQAKKAALASNKRYTS